MGRGGFRRGWGGSGKFEAKGAVRPHRPSFGGSLDACGWEVRLRKLDPRGEESAALRAWGGRREQLSSLGSGRGRMRCRAERRADVPGALGPRGSRPVSWTPPAPLLALPLPFGAVSNAASFAPASRFRDPRPRRRGRGREGLRALGGEGRAGGRGRAGDRLQGLSGSEGREELGQGRERGMEAPLVSLQIS